MITKNINGQNLSQAFIDAVTDSSTPYVARILYNGSPVQCDIKSITVTKGTVAALEGFNIGAVISSEVVAEVMNLSTALKDKVIEVQIGLVTDESLGTVEYIKMGEFVVSTAEQTAYMTVLTAYGYTVGKTGGDFISPQDLIPPQTLTLAHIASQITAGTGVPITWDPGIDTTAELTLPLSGITNYQALQILAGVVGGYAVDTNTGGIYIGLFDDTVTHNISAGLMVNLPQYEEQDFEITGVYVNTAAGAMGSQTDINLVTDSQWLTADMFSDYESNIVGYTYRPASCGLTIGDPRIEGIDVLQVTNIDGSTFIMPCHKIVHKCTGGLTSNIQSATATQLENAIATPPPLSEQVVEAVSKANEALEAVEDMGDTAQYFWHTTTDTGAGAGSHITQVSQAEFLDDPDAGGANTLINSLGMQIRKGLTPVAQFAEEEIDLGLDSENAAITMCKKRGSISTKYTEGFDFIEPMPFTYQASTTKNGLTFTVDSSEGKITVTGTATADTIYQVSNYIQTPDGNDYRLEGCPEGGSEDTFFLYAGRYDGYVWHADYGDSVMWHRSEGSVVLYIFVKQGVTMDNEFLPDMWRGIILNGVTLSLSNNAPDEDYSKSIEMYTHYGEEETEDLQEAYFRLGLEKTGEGWASLWLGDNFGINFADNQMVVEGDSSNPVQIIGRQNRDAMLRVEHYNSVAVRLGVGIGGENHGVWSEPLNKWMLYTNGNDETIVGAINVTDASSARDSSKSAGVLKIHTQTINIGTLAANTAKADSVVANITGSYEGYAISGYYVSGTGQSSINVYGLRFIYGSQTIDYKVRNMSSSQATGITLEVRVLCSYNGD